MLSKLTKTYLGATIPVINVIGPIQPQLTEKVVHRLHRINTTRAVALAVVVNSPGGMPVQSEIIAAKIKDFSAKHNLKLYTFARDVAASGGYMVLSTGDHVVADYSSIVGSIGVVFQKLKLKGLLEQLSADHKVFASNNKLLHNALSPFEQLDPAAQQYLKRLCEQSHARFVRDVKKHRGNKIKEDATTFSGEVFLGGQALKRGLVDEVGSMVQVLSKRFPDAQLQIQGQIRTVMERVFDL